MPHRTIFSRSRGPGGQNVNKLSTRVSVFLRPEAIPETFKALLRRKHSSIFTKDGRAVFHCDLHRTQYDNREECYRRIHRIFSDVAEENTPKDRDPQKSLIIDERLRAASARRVQKKKLIARLSKKDTRRDD